jgi:hypothetical protein
VTQTKRQEKKSPEHKQAEEKFRRHYGLEGRDDARVLTKSKVAGQ